jgi:hypothetical protein
LGLRSHIEWWKWTTGRLQRPNVVEKPPDIPTGPERVYPNEWRDWADWLGHRRRIGGWRPFVEAREFARGLNLTSRKEWAALAQNGNAVKQNVLPSDIPAQPDNVYREWVGWWDWLGTRHRRGDWLSFDRARALARKLGLKSEGEFIRWRRGLLKHELKCPPDMPMHPDRVYPGFKNWPDFLRFTPRTWMPFEQAKKFVRRLGLRNQKEYRQWVTGRLQRKGVPIRPESIPNNPDQVYSAQWQGFNNFIGTAKPKNIGRTWRNFADARSYVRSLKLSSVVDYKNWAKGNLKDKPTFPDDIPAWPPQVYSNSWNGFADFLGIRPSPKHVQMWPFLKARNFVRKLRLSSPTEYAKWTSGAMNSLASKPDEVPVAPSKKYRNQWRGWDDWLGNVR